jgi:hypothetical protein
LQALNPVWVITGWLRGGPGEALTKNSPALLP